MSDTDFTSRLAVRAEAVGITVSEGQAIRLRVYADLLAHWNKRINLTGLPLAGWPDQTLDRLFLEPIGALPLIAASAGVWVDFGSGGGSPALPLAVSLEGFQLTLTESRGKKAAFLREAIRALELKNAKVEGRFEGLLTWPKGSVQLITCRAVRLSDIAGVADHLLSEHGRMLFFGETQGAPGGFQLMKTSPLPEIGATISTFVH